MSSWGGAGGSWNGGYGSKGSGNSSSSYERKEAPVGYGHKGDSNGSNGYGNSRAVVAPSDSWGSGKSNSYGNSDSYGNSWDRGGNSDSWDRGGNSDSYGKGGGKSDRQGYGGKGDSNGYGGKGDSNGYGGKGDSNGYSSGGKGDSHGNGGKGDSNGYGNSRAVVAPSDSWGGGKSNSFDNRDGNSDSYGKGGSKSDRQGYGSNGYSNGGKGDSNGYGDGNWGGGWGDSREGARFSDLGANLQDVDWSKEDVASIGKVSGSYLAAAGARGKHEIEAWKQQNSIQTWGRDVANPILTFEETGFPQFILDSFRRQNFKLPSLIQQAGWGPAMAGRDVVGVAKTGSGKTLAFGIPGLLHIGAQPELNRGDGPMMLVLAPTRELGQQIHVELQKVMPKNLRGAIIFGGAPKYDQKRELKWGVHVMVATPGRLIDFIETGVTNLKRVTYLVMDEADRMLDMGFEPDVRKIVGQCPPNRQTLLWSATWPTAIQRLARDFQNDIVHIQVGSTELSANDDITQKIIMTHGWQQKQEEIVRQLWDLDQQGIKKVLVFSSTKKGADELSNVIRQAGFLTGAIHGDKEQSQRETALSHLKSKPRFVLVATDVASRGLDIPKLPAVINFDFPDLLEDYVHRIGRTGRAGNKGLAITFFTAAKDCGHAAKLIDLLKKAGQQIPHGLERCTSMTPPEKDRSKWGKNSGGGGGGSGGRGGGGNWGGKGGSGGWGGGGKY